MPGSGYVQFQDWLAQAHEATGATAASELRHGVIMGTLPGKIAAGQASGRRLGRG